MWRRKYLDTLSRGRLGYVKGVETVGTVREREDSAVLECVLGHGKRGEGGGHCCRAAPFVDRWLFFGEFFWGGGGVRWNRGGI